MVTQNENENEVHFGNFLLKNKTKSVLVIRTENENEFVSFSFWLTIRIDKTNPFSFSFWRQS